MKDPLFLTLAEVVEIHKSQIELYGGSHGCRDLGLLQSALAQPEASFGGEWLHRNLFEMAAAYAFHLCQNHPFFDGNKRVALVSTLVFLEMNSIAIEDPKKKLLGAMLEIASGQMTKEQLAEVLRGLAK